MSDKQLAKIERLLGDICKTQTALCEKLEALERRGAGGSGAATCEETVAFLDQFRANEAAAVNWIGAWIENSDVACVRGGLRTVQQRESMHAQLLESRIKELGGSCTYQVPEADRKRYLETFGGTACSDAEKVKALVEEVGDCDAFLKPFDEFANRLDGDPETQFLLRTIVQDERSTIQFLNDACAMLNG
ncbi:MAG: hypothetical protein HKP27_12835 [Myxococcales bacterium]|nr:hypothetical protein [Myxococcales bacterium]